MPATSYDGKSLLVDGRRVFLVSGSIHYPRVARGLWASRIAAARQAGLNCIDTFVFWNVHEPRPGRFVFDGQADLRHFIELIADAGMYCILRPGPFIDGDWEFGGLPAWLNTLPNIGLRQGSGPMLEAAARYLGAVMEQVRDLQATVSTPARPQGGPIVLMQAENRWFCHNPQQADSYLRELIRFLRENGCNVPIALANNLWQRVDGVIDTWQASSRLLEDLRQLQVIQPLAPRIVSQYHVGGTDTWGEPSRDGIDARTLGFQLLEMLAGGGQYNIFPFHGGTNLGFWGGCCSHTAQRYVTTSHDCQAPLGEAGQRGDKYRAVKRVSTFASQFAHVLANLDGADAHTAVAAHPHNGALSVVHLHGDQGQAVFLLRGSKDRTQEVDLVLPQGVGLRVPIGDDCSAWLLLNVRLGAATLNYTNLRPWAWLDRRMLVLFGPAGAQGVVCINEAPLPVVVPSGRKPLIEPHEDLTIVVLNIEMMDAAVVDGDRLVVGVAGLDEQQQPLPLPGWPSAVAIDSSGQSTTLSARRGQSAKAVELGPWRQADLDDLIDGSAAAYQPIDGPASLESLKQPYGYGWYRLQFKGGSTSRVMAPHSGDRLQFFAAGRSLGLIGHGPGAQSDPINLKLAGTVTVLADHLGRASYSTPFVEPRGLFGHLLAVRSVVLGKPQVVAGRAADPFALTQFVPFARKDDHPSADTLVWSVKFAGRKPLLLAIDGLPLRAMVLLDEQPVALYEPGQSARIVLPPSAGSAELKLALFSTLERLSKQHRGLQATRHLKLYQVTEEPTAKAQWSFASWGPPPAERFGPLAKKAPPVPRWYRASFSVANTSTPLWLEARGLSKGQVLLNGHNVGRYFVSTAAGKAVPPQLRYYLPEPWLRVGEPNELILFDEHGKSPDKVRLVHAPGHAPGPQ